MEKTQLSIKEETREAVINALKKMANRKNANQLREIIDAIKTLNLRIDEQWALLDTLASKVVKFKQSGNIQDLQ